MAASYRWATVIVAAVALVPRAAIAQPFQSLTVSYELASSVTLNEPVEVHFAVVNRGPVPVRFDLGLRFTSNFVVSVTDPAGATAAGLRFKDADFGSPGGVELDAGESYSQDLLLNQWYDFKRPGKYRVTIRVLTSVQENDGTPIRQSLDGELDFVIGARDEGRIRQTCADLTDVAIGSKSVVQAQRAVISLSYVNDSACVAAMNDVLHAPNIGSIVAPALQRIATSEAVDALISGLNGPSASMIDACRSALTALQSSVKDPALRDRIRTALSREPS